MRRTLPVFSLLLLFACGTTEEASPPPTPEPEAVEPPPPPPPPPPVEEPIADCPTDTWSVAANGPNRATDSGVEAAGWARSMPSGWERFRVCKTVDDHEIRLSCAPVARGAECSLGLPTQRCSATLPGPTLPIAVGQLIDTGEQPSEGSWTCSRR
jgi:hypothetical protein